MSPRPLFFSLALAVPIASQAQRSLTEIPEPDPVAELADFVVADGFEVNLFASDPMIRKPIQIAFGADGKLWVASSAIYPQISPGQPESDQIVVLEDTDHDGTADKSTVFADGFLIPTGVLPGDGGAYVADSTDMIFLEDTDGDGRADTEEVVLSGFGTEDTHHIIHAFTWGPGGEMFFNQSIYIHSHVETPWGVKRLDAGGIWRFQREALRLDVFSRGMVNPWGHVFDDWGQSFATDGAYHEGINYVFPGAQYLTAVDATRILAGLNSGEPKHSGLARVSGRHFPDDWQGNMLANDFRANRVNRFVISEAGSGYASEKKDDLLRSRRVTFRPVDIKMGPDGAIYIADWYNPIIQHGEVDFRDERRDKGHGRIWRITAKNRPLVKKPDIVGASVDGLLEMLGAPEQWTRDQARLRLQRMGVSEALVAKVRSHADGGDAQAKLQALWVLQGLGEVDPELLEQNLNSPDHRARAAAVRMIYYGVADPADSIAVLRAASQDAHPQVRLEAVRALGLVPTLDAAAAALSALDGTGTDRFLDYALWLTARELAPVWLPAVREGSFDFGGRVAHLIYALKAVNSPEVAAPLAAIAADATVAADRRAEAAEFLANIGGAGELDLLYALVREDAIEPALSVRVLASLEQAAAERKVTPSGDLGHVRELIAGGAPEVRRAAIQLAGAWNVADAATELIGLLKDPASGPELRRAAIEGLAGMAGEASKAALEEVTAGSAFGAERVPALAALAKIDLGRAAAAGAKLLQAPEMVDAAASIYPIFVGRRDGPAALAHALGDAELDSAVAEAGIRAVAASGQAAPALEACLRTAGGLAAAPMAPTAEQMAALVAAVEATGDPVRGETIYRRPQLLCINCHAIGGAGGRVGPDLVSIGASAPIDYLIDSLLIPEAKVKEGYHLTTVTTKDGGVFAGTGARETDTHLVLIDAANKDQAIPLDQIASKEIGKSLMPAGLTASLSRAEFIDLVRFLHDLGRTPELSIAGGDQAVRSWSVESKAAASRLPVTGRVSGEITDADLAAAVGQQGSYELYFQLEVAAPGDITFLLNDTDGLNRLSFQGNALSPAPELTVGAPAGRHEGMVRLIPSQRKTPLKISIRAGDGVEGAAAGVRVVTPE